MSRSLIVQDAVPRRQASSLKSLTPPERHVSARDLVKGTYIIEDESLCKVTSVTRYERGGKGGSPKCCIKWRNLATDSTHERMRPAGAMFTRVLVRATTYELLDVDRDGFVSLLSARGEVRADLKPVGDLAASISLAVRSERSGKVIVVEGTDMEVDAAVESFEAEGAMMGPRSELASVPGLSASTAFDDDLNRAIATSTWLHDEEHAQLAWALQQSMVTQQVNQPANPPAPIQPTGTAVAQQQQALQKQEKECGQSRAAGVMVDVSDDWDLLEDECWELV